MEADGARSVNLLRICIDAIPLALTIRFYSPVAIPPGTFTFVLCGLFPIATAIVEWLNGRKKPVVVLVRRTTVYARL